MDDVTLTRKVLAPRILVFGLWVHPRHLEKWWGSREFFAIRCDLDVRQVGPSPLGGFYQEIVIADRLVFSLSGLDELGHPLFDVLNTITFEDEGDFTRLTATLQVLRITEDGTLFLQRLTSAWEKSLDRLRLYTRTLMERLDWA